MPDRLGRTVIAETSGRTLGTDEPLRFHPSSGDVVEWHTTANEKGA